MSKVYWINHKGQKVDIDTMDENYLRNALKKVMRAKAQEEFMSDYEEKKVKRLFMDQIGFDSDMIGDGPSDNLWK